MDGKKAKPVVGVVLFEGFELLDVFGPLELFRINQSLFDCVMLAENAGNIASFQGPRAEAELAISHCKQVDVLLVPGGYGTRQEIGNSKLLGEISRLAKTANYVSSVCTGAAILAKTGILDGRKATTNKAAWQWATSQGPNVDWIPQARWVEDGKYFTSSGVSAGMDMALGLIETVYDKETSLDIAKFAEYDWHQDSSWDPFAEVHGLIG